MHDMAMKRKRLFKLQEGKCAICGCACHLTENLNDKQFTIDHIIPRAANGTNDFSNLVGVCRKCNGEKSSKIDIDVNRLYPYIDGYRKLEIIEYINKYISYRCNLNEVTRTKWKRLLWSISDVAYEEIKGL